MAAEVTSDASYTTYSELMRPDFGHACGLFEDLDSG